MMLLELHEHLAIGALDRKMAFAATMDADVPRIDVLAVTHDGLTVGFGSVHYALQCDGMANNVDFLNGS